MHQEPISYWRIKAGMRLIAEGCAATSAWADCKDCPFDDYCTAIMKETWEIPSDWLKEEREE